MHRHEDPAIQAACDAWAYSTLLIAEHTEDCRSGCSALMMRCPAGMILAEHERRTWREYFDVRRAAGVEVAVS